MRSAFFLLLLAVAALAQKDDSGDDGTSTADDSDGDATETTTQRSTKSKASSKPTESAQPNSQKCIVGCTAPIARQYGCTSMRDIPCICGSDDFVSDVENCLKKECTADQQASAMGLIKGNCGASFKMKFARVAFLALASAVLAQDSTSSASGAAPTSTAGISQCLLQCTTTAASANGCSSVTDLQCLCTSASFQNDAKSCMQDNCTEEEQQAGLQLQAAECANIGTASASEPSSSSDATSGSGSPSTSKTSSGAGSTSTGPSSTQSEAASSATDSNAASGMRHAFFTIGGVAAPAIVITLGGVLVGAAVVLL
ncbi:hypothetical protein HDZ31DRAFT_63826 [Schizophyllum fasciatum]